MSKSELDPRDRLGLLASLETLLGCMKALHATVESVMADVASMRSTVFEDPVELVAYRANLRLAVAPEKPAVEEALSSYEDFLQDVVESRTTRIELQGGDLLSLPTRPASAQELAGLVPISGRVSANSFSSIPAEAGRSCEEDLAQGSWR
jgi:hypothetical protein